MKQVLVLLGVLALLVPAGANGQTMGDWLALGDRIVTHPDDELRFGVACFPAGHASVLLSSDRYLRDGDTGDEISVTLVADSAAPISGKWILEQGSRYATVRAPYSDVDDLMRYMLGSSELQVTYVVPRTGERVQRRIAMSAFRPALRKLECARGWW